MITYTTLDTFLTRKYKSGNQYPKKYYFLWRNKVDTYKYNLSTMPEEEFVNIFLKGDKERLITLKKWEGSDEYKELLKVYIRYKTNIDLVEIYEAVRKKAIEGDNTAVKTFLTLQKEIEKETDIYFKDDKKKNKNIDQDQEEDDDLLLD